MSRAAEYAVFVDLPLVPREATPGFHWRIFTYTDVNTGGAIKCDFVTSIVSSAPDVYLSMVSQATANLVPTPSEGSKRPTSRRG